MLETEKLLYEYLPFYRELTSMQKGQLIAACVQKHFDKGASVHSGFADCVGLILVLNGLLRVYTLSDEGRELTLYRLCKGEMCLFSASCVFSGVSFDIMVSAQESTDVLIISPVVYKKLMSDSPAVANYTNTLMAEHFSEVMWMIDQIQNKKLDSRLAALLLEEGELSGSLELAITHEELASHLGSAREVITRMLKYFQADGMVSLSRGCVTLSDTQRLRAVAADSIKKNSKKCKNIK